MAGRRRRKPRTVTRDRRSIIRNEPRISRKASRHFVINAHRDFVGGKAGELRAGMARPHMGLAQASQLFDERCEFGWHLIGFVAASVRHNYVKRHPVDTKLTQYPMQALFSRAVGLSDDSFDL